MDCFSVFKRTVGPTCVTLLNDWWNCQRKIWFNVKCHHLRKGGSKQRHSYSLQFWCNFCLALCQSQEKLKPEAHQSSQFLPVVSLALSPRFWIQYFTVKRPRSAQYMNDYRLFKQVKVAGSGPLLIKHHVSIGTAGTSVISSIVLMSYKLSAV